MTKAQQFLLEIKKKPIKEVEEWISKYTSENGGVEAVVHGGCEDFVNNFKNFVAEDCEVWALFDIWSKKLSDNLPLQVTNNKNFHKLVMSLEGVDVREEGLSEIGDEYHVVVKWLGSYWDGHGKQSLKEITNHFDAAENPHWFRLE